MAIETKKRLIVGALGGMFGMNDDFQNDGGSHGVSEDGVIRHARAWLDACELMASSVMALS